MWRKSRLKFIENKKSDLIWLLLHDVVRVRYSFRAWGNIDADLCVVCSLPETAKHCFVDCRRTVRVWNYFAASFSRLLRFPFVLSSLSVLFPFSVCSSSPGPSVFYYLAATILFFVWHACNLATFRNRTLGFRSIVNNVIKDVKLRVQGDSLDRVKSFWSASNVVCSVSVDNHITFHL